MKVLVNGIGISDSGGIFVLENFIQECLEVGSENKFIIILKNSEAICALVDKYQSYDILFFRILKFNSYMYRLYFENFLFTNIVNKNNIDLVYNFTGTFQIFLKCPQLVKVHNLIFYSKVLDICYKKKYGFISWIRIGFIKSLVFKIMLNYSNNIEVQSKHVKNCLSDYIKIKNKNFFIKSDIKISDSSFKKPRTYDFSKKIKFLYIVGPHFNSMHKNFLDFTGGMLELLKLNVDFEINITLTKEQLELSGSWNELLDSKTNFYGYINDSKDMEHLFCDNAVLISTSIIESLGLHVVDAIKNGVVTVTPSQSYAHEVYGGNRYCYELFDYNSLCRVIINLINNEDLISNSILYQQKYLRENEITKLNNIVDVFTQVLNIKK